MSILLNHILFDIDKVLLLGFLKQLNPIYPKMFALQVCLSPWKTEFTKLAANALDLLFFQ